MVFAVIFLVAGLMTSLGPPGVSAVFIFLAIISWFVRVPLADLETSKLAEGNHALLRYSTSDDVVAKELVKNIDSCEISVAVYALKTPAGTILGFGNPAYAAEFKGVNSAVESI